MRGQQRLGLADLRGVFEAPPGRAEHVGLEVEVGLVDRGSRRNATYGQATALFDDVARTYGGSLLTEGAQTIGVELAGGAQFTLETGGALEYSSPPFPTVAEAVADVRAHLQLAAGLADRHGIALLSGGIVPFTAADGIAWNPKPRVQVMRDYFGRLGPDGAYADEVMGLVLSAQTSLDYTDSADLMDKLRLLVRASPVVAALFVDSPVAGGAPTGVMSRRMQYWRHFDPRRCGVLAVALDAGAGIDDLVDWAARLPMIYRLVGGSHVAAAPIPFREAVERGFGDGTYPTPADWELHLSQVWPHVRVRRTLELRLADAPPWPWFGAGAALWTGLAYDPAARRAADDLLSGLTAADLDRASAEIAVKGLSATIGPYLVQDLARDLLRLARQGLSARVIVGLEEPETLTLLEPVEEVCETMRSFADHALDSWEHGKDHFLAEFSIPAAS
ncbi:glutamate-cysteine ligase family protein [Dactylosporangium sp. AC04546]|uniref:glutamate-cysteine ligase family protein n=1 Tax=Dactylosporangium sp. AC04546 TaxID=2862460 RepID=UPI001EE00263|nr:glutamate-cysteine ligase family protein [Dactylosporangium sp. AC04546]WVK83643.1 glutamate-cysteine ligase family protein [Dactylosporangium sp. AC04546]